MDQSQVLVISFLCDFCVLFMNYNFLHTMVYALFL